MIVDADQLDAVTPVRRRGGGEPRLEQADRLVVRALTERRETRGRQRRRLVRSVVPTQIDRHECRHERDCRQWPAGVPLLRQHHHRDGRRGEDDCGRDRGPRQAPTHHRMRQPKRACDECDRNEDFERALPAACRRHRTGEPAMHEVAGDDGNERDQHEVGVRRPAVEIDRRQHVVHQVEGGGVTAEIVEQHQHSRDGEEPDLTREGEAAQESQ